MANALSFRFVLIISALLLCSCSRKDWLGDSISKQYRESQSGVCTLNEKSLTEKSQPLHTPFDLEGRKVLIRAKRGVSTFSEPVLSKGTRLVTTINIACQKGAGGLKLRTEPFILQADVTLTELEKWADEDECILGISENRAVFRTSMVTNDTRYGTPNLTPNETRFGELAHLKAIKAPEGYNTFYSTDGADSEVIIAVIDTGVDVTHPDLAANIWKNALDTPGNNVDEDLNGYVDDSNGYNFADDNGDPAPQVFTDDPGGEVHGTHVAGLIAAAADNTVGVAGVMGRKAKIMALNIFGDNSGADVTNLDNAIYYAADNGAKVINMSLGACTSSPSTETAIAYAIRKGATIVTAAGNENRELSDIASDEDNCDLETGKVFVIPGSLSKKYAGVITVGSTNAANGARSGFSNFSTELVDLGAPGSNTAVMPSGLLSTLPGNMYGVLQGTSMSSPVVAGAAALAISLAKSRFKANLTPSQVEEIILQDAPAVTALSSFFKGGKTLDLKVLATTILANEFPTPVCP